MANLEKILQDQSERKRSIDRMLGEAYARDEVKCNHGIKDQGELQQRVCAPSFEADSDTERTASFEGLLGKLS